MELPLFRCLEFFCLFLKIFQREEIIKLWGLILILVLILRNSELRNSTLQNSKLRNNELRNSELWNSELRNGELRNSVLWNSELRHAVNYSENSGSGIAELRTGSSGL
jgi:uncharacterized protein YjbI with pentapeptide repeats